MMNINEIREVLAHRPPFLHVDRVLELTEGESIVAIRAVSNNETLFEGHFPDNPILPGVIIIESMAQAAGILALKTISAQAAGNTKKAYVVAGVDKSRFRKFVLPGDLVVLKATVINRKKTIWKFKTVAEVDGQEVASALITCAEKDV